MTTISHMYDRVQIVQTSEDSVIAGRSILKGYVNATHMCQANGKQLKRYNELKSSIAYREAFSRSVVQNDRPMFIFIDTGENHLRGVWMHPVAAMDLARWISPAFAVWCDEVLSRVAKGEFIALTEEAAIAQARLKELNASIWAESRKLGKMARRTLTDAIKEYLLLHDGELSENYRQWVYCNATDAMYYAVFGMTALKLESLLGCGRNQSREFLSSRSLQRIDRVESGICQLIDVQSIEPCEAVQRYVNFFKLKPVKPEAKRDA